MCAKKTTTCPDCSGTVPVLHNPKDIGYVMCCPHCGGEIPLCDACMADNGLCDFNSSTGKCHRTQEGETK